MEQDNNHKTYKLSPFYRLVHIAVAVVLAYWTGRFVVLLFQVLLETDQNRGIAYFLSFIPLLLLTAVLALFFLNWDPNLAFVDEGILVQVFIFWRILVRW